MLIRVNVDAAEDKLTEFSAGAKLYWARDNSSATGAFTDASGNVALVATQTQYEIIDSTGAVGHYYRTRVGNSGGTSFDTWSDVFQAGSVTAYATLDSLREYLNLPDNSQDNLLSDLLVDASDTLSSQCGRDFFRHPGVSGTEIRTFDGNARNVLYVPAGIVSLSLVELATQTGGTFSSLATTDWLLEPSDKTSEWSYTRLRLSNVGSYPYFYPGYANVRLTGVFGWASVPALVRKATLDLAYKWYQESHGGAQPLGVGPGGMLFYSRGDPLSVKQAVSTYGPALVA